MFELFQAIVMGVIEGVTEFLPVSSTGHMIIAQPLLGIDPELPQWRVFLVVSQLGAIAAVIVYFWRKLWQATFHPHQPGWSAHIIPKLLIAMAPAVLLQLVFKVNDLLEAYLEKPVPVAIALIIGAFLIWWIDSAFRTRRRMEVDDVTLLQAFLIGCAQCVAMCPGTSRSAATIMGGMMVGLSPSIAAEFSFFLAIPTMFGASAVRLWKYRGDLNTDGLAIILIGAAVSFLVALLVIAAFMSYIKRRRFTAFVVYRILLGVTVLVWWRFAAQAA
ncbi:MAG: undecaprenyl-diphosphate phosphatase [Phycisphaerales bacterium]|nr:undecaprenyl-diphosphate phosphatase [Phycisphaerales bacterium]